VEPPGRGGLGRGPPGVPARLAARDGKGPEGERDEGRQPWCGGGRGERPVGVMWRGIGADGGSQSLKSIADIDMRRTVRRK